MSNLVEALVLDLLEWIGDAPRDYDEVLDAWRTSCPRLTVWEDASELGLLEVSFEPGRGRFVSVSQAGREYVRAHRASAH